MAAKYSTDNADDKSLHNQRFSDFVAEPGTMLMPIQGYEKQPLVTLEEAVEPIIQYVPDVKRMAYVAKMKCQNPPADKLSLDESASIMLYSMEWEPRNQCLYYALNETLRSENRKQLTPWFLFLKLILTAFARLPSTHRFVYRGIKRDMRKDYPEGSTIIWWGFSSCTSNIGVLNNEQFLGSKGTRTLITIECTSGKDIRHHSSYQHEDEILLPPGRQFKVVACLNQPGDLYMIQLKEVEPKFPLLEPLSKNITPMPELMTISFPINMDICVIQSLEFQEFVKKLEQSQHVTINIDETDKFVSISGKKAAVNTSESQIKIKIRKISSGPRPDQMLLDTIELSAAKNNFLEFFGQKILDTIRKEPGINSASIINGKLQLSGDNSAITKIKSYLEQTLHEKNISISCGIQQHLELTCGGRMLKEFLQKYRVGTSLQGFRRYDKIKGNRIRKHPIHLNPADSSHGRGSQTRGQRGSGNGIRGQYGRGNGTRGQYGRGRGTFSAYNSSSHIVQDLSELHLNDDDTKTSQNNFDDHESKEQYNTESNVNEYEDDDDDGDRSETSDPGASLSSNFVKDFDDRTKELIEITLCCDSEDSLSKAVAELRNYSLYVESWALTQDEITFILKQQQHGKPQQSNISVRDRCIQIKSYLSQFVRDYSIDIYVYYLRGMWHVKLRGLKQVRSTVSKIKDCLNNLVEIEVPVPISKAMAFFLRTKASYDIRKLENNSNIKITIFSPISRKHTNDINDEQDNGNDCLKLIGSISRINLAQIEVENFLESLSEREQNFPCDTWDLSKNISNRILTCLKKIQDSNDYEAIGRIKFYNSAIERRETTPKVTFTVVSMDEETADDVIQQCKDIIEGYVIWKPSADEFRAIMKKSSQIDEIRKEWDTDIELDRNTITITISARSKMIADEIKGALQSLSIGKVPSINRISEVISIERNIRRFVNQAIGSLLDQAKAKKVFIDYKNHNELTLHGRSEVVTSIKDQINTIIKDIKRQIITHRLRLSLTESELIRTKSYEIAKRIERETNTIIRDVKIDTKCSTLNVNDDDDDISLTITGVVNNRGQTILVKKGDIIKAKDVDAIVNAANGPLYHAGGVDKVIADAAGPALDYECKQLIDKNGGVAISTGKAVKTTAGNLPFKCVIHAIGPQYTDGNQQERPLLFFSILSSLQLAEEEGHKSIALPAISSMTYGFPLQDCTNIVIRAVKQFFADFPQSHIRKVILLDTDDSACNAFAREVVNDHKSAVNNDDIINYTLPPPLMAKWCWQDDNDEKIYDENHTRQIENAFQQYLKTFISSTLTITVDNLKYATIIRYSIHFLPNLKQILTASPNALKDSIVCGYQISESTGFKRYIIRYPLEQQETSISVVYRPKPLDIYHLQVVTTGDDWDITSITRIAIQQAETKIRKAIESATISEPFSVNLDQDIDTHKKAITNIAMQQSIQVNFEQDRKEKLSLILKGLQQNVLQAKLKIALYAQDILKMEIDKDDQLNIPKEWGDQEDEWKLVELPKNHHDFIRIENRMKETMKNVKIDKIERVQNLRLWNHYAFRRRTLQQELSNKPNLQIEMELFHGTRNTLPSEIYNGEYGFDRTFSTSGLWGLGTYFAKNASYACQSYSYQLHNGKRQVFLAQVLTGDVYDYKYKNDPTLRGPPKKNESISGVRYNSVSGQTGGSQVYVIYENRLAYPTYLITFIQ